MAPPLARMALQSTGRSSGEHEQHDRTESGARSHDRNACCRDCESIRHEARGAGPAVAGRLTATLIGNSTDAGTRRAWLAWRACLRDRRCGGWSLAGVAGPSSDGDTMKAIRYYRYGPPDVLELRDIDRPAVGDDEVLVRVRAASVNPLDWHFMRGTPYLVRAIAGLSRPKASATRLGADMAGSVEAVGKNVTEFRPGDEVFGGLEDRGTLAEYISIRQDAVLLKKPANITFEQAASVPVAGCTAVQALRDKGRVRTFTVQLAKAFGAEVTGVCSTKNVEIVASIGADQVIDYTQEDFTRAGRRYDLLVDIAGNRTLAETRRVLVPTGVLVAVGGPNKGRWLEPLGRSVGMVLLSPAVSQRMTFFLAHLNRADLAVLRELLEAGKVRPVIDRTYPLGECAEAIDYLEQGHAVGKVAITV